MKISTIIAISASCTMGLIFFLLAYQTTEYFVYATGISESITSTAFDPSGDTIAIAGGTNCEITFWDVLSREVIRTFSLCSADRVYKQDAGRLEYSPDGEQLLVGSYTGNNAQILHTQQGQTVTSLLGHTGSIKDVAWSPNGDTVGTVSADGTIRIWNAADGSERLIITVGDTSINCINFSHDGLIVLTGGDDGILTTWNAITGDDIVNFIGHTDSIQSCKFNPNGDGTAASAGYDGTLRIWNTLDGSLTRVESVDGWVSDLAYNGTGNLIACGIWFIDDIHIFSFEDTAFNEVIHHSEKQHGHLVDLEFSRVGNLLITAAGNTVHVWTFDHSS